MIKALVDTHFCLCPPPPPCMSKVLVPGPVEKWWPNGLGQQKLYNVSASFIPEGTISCSMTDDDDDDDGGGGGGAAPPCSTVTRFVM